MDREEVGRRLLQIATEALDEDFECPVPEWRGQWHCCFNGCYSKFLKEKNGT